MELVQTRGLILYNRNYREADKLVKIFTETAGKRMFFVKQASKSKLGAVIQPLMVADFLLKVSDQGLSYIQDYGQATAFKQINGDIFKLGHASYLVGLADAAIQDAVPDPALFAFLVKTLELMESGLDEEILTFIFEIQVLSRFGVTLNLHECAFCHRSGLPFDYSYACNGVLCPQHYDQDVRRSHVDPNVLYLLQQFQAVQLDQLSTLTLKKATKQKLRAFMDELYDNYVGVQLKSKKFLDGLADWGGLMRGE